MSFHFLIFLYFSWVFREHLRDRSPCAICLFVSWQSQLASCCLLSFLVSSLPLPCLAASYLPQLSCRPSPQLCTVISCIVQMFYPHCSICLPPSTIFFLLPFFSPPPRNSNFGEQQLCTTELSRTEHQAKRFSCYVTRLIIYLHVIASVASESLHFIFFLFFMITTLNWIYFIV